MDTVLDNSGFLKAYGVPIVLKGPEGSYAHGSPAIRMASNWALCLDFLDIFEKWWTYILFKSGAERGNSFGNDF
jgi:hypothetical protein